MQLRVHLCFVCSPRHFVYQCCLLLTERRMNDVITSFSLARHCTSAASQHEFRMHLPRGKKLSRTCRARCRDSEARWVDLRWTAKCARDLRSVAIHGRAGHLFLPVSRMRLVSRRARPARMACAGPTMACAGPTMACAARMAWTGRVALALGSASASARLAPRALRFACSWWLPIFCVSEAA